MGSNESIKMHDDENCDMGKKEASILFFIDTN